MSDLQIGLLILGVFIIAGVVAFNWWQERQLRRRAEGGLQRPEADVLLEPSIQPEPERVEPRIEPDFDGAEEPAREPARQAPPKPVKAAAPAERRPAASARGEVLPDAAIDYISEIRAGEVIPASAIEALTAALSAVGRRVAMTGYDYHTREWQAVADPEHWYTSLRLALQLVDRSGSVSEQQLRNFQSVIREHASGMSAIAELPDFEVALEKARDLDDFCAEVDVMVGINVIAQSGQVFQGTQVRALAEAAGFRLQPSGVFVCEDGQGDALFTLDNQEANPFLPDQIRRMTTSGVTFLLDVPRVADGIRAFDRMLATSRSFADSLDGLLADDNRALLNDVGLDKIRAQLQAIYAAMESRGLPAGAPATRRLFS
ncbi:MAG: cell division protein ZipA C-terminal FtsZ-binding domain-containing protein [Burkholderiales bacterium]